MAAGCLGRRLIGGRRRKLRGRRGVETHSPFFPLPFLRSGGGQGPRELNERTADRDETARLSCASGPGVARSESPDWSTRSRSLSNHSSPLSVFSHLVPLSQVGEANKGVSRPPLPSNVIIQVTIQGSITCISSPLFFLLVSLPLPTRRTEERRKRPRKGGAGEVL